MTATDELRRLLDERGVGSYTHEAPAAVCLAFFDGKRWHDCWESVGGEVNVTFSLTPAQAVAATLGNDGVGRTNDGLADLQAENAKLRELAEKAWKAAEMLCQAWDGPCRADGVSIMSPCPMGERDELCVYGLIQRDLRELGVEVDG